MAAITFNVNDAFVPRIVAAFRAEFPLLTQGLTDAQAIKAVIKDHVRQVLVDFEGQQAIATQNSQIITLSSNAQTVLNAQQAQTTTDTGANIT